jgi:DNA polymerase-3 subunit delta
VVAVKAGDVAGILKRPQPGIGVFLVYGPDAGLVHERAQEIAQRSIPDPADPFQLIRMDGDVIAADPPRLADEAGTVGLFGGQRAIWVKATSRNLAPAVAPILAEPLQDTVVVIEAGDLAKSAPLRTLCERSQRALALPCYADSARDLGALVDDSLRQAGLAIARDARATLLASLGGDRLATRGELAKLILYVHGQQEITLQDVDAVLSDVSALAIDAVVDAAFAGDRPALETGLRRLAAERVSASTLLGAALRQAVLLLSACLDVEEGRSASQVVESWRGLHFSRKRVVERQVQTWSTKSLRHAIARIQAAILETRRLSDLDQVIAGKTLLDIARVTKR